MRRTLRCVVRLTIALSLLVVAAAPALAGTPTERVREFFGSVNRVIADPSFDDRPQERLSALRRLVVDVVDFRNAAALALGQEWAPRTPAEREDFIRLFGELLQTSVFASVGSRARVDNGLVVTYIAEMSDQNGATVATSVLTRSGGEMAVGYRMLAKDGRWVVYDVVVDGVSLIDNYRAQFQKVIQRSSYAGLVSEMRSRIYDLGRTPTQVAAAPPPSAVTTIATAVTMPAAPPAREPVVAAPQPSVVVSDIPRPATVVVKASPREEASVAPRFVDQRPVEPPRATSKESAYWVQVGAFSSTARAEKAVLGLQDFPVSLMIAPGDALMRVRVGPFANREAAAAKLREIRTRGYESAYIFDPNR